MFGRLAELGRFDVFGFSYHTLTRSVHEGRNLVLLGRIHREISCLVNSTFNSGSSSSRQSSHNVFQFVLFLLLLNMFGLLRGFRRCRFRLDRSWRFWIFQSLLDRSRGRREWLLNTMGSRLFFDLGSFGLCWGRNGAGSYVDNGRFLRLWCFGHLGRHCFLSFFHRGRGWLSYRLFSWFRFFGGHWCFRFFNWSFNLHWGRR